MAPTIILSTGVFIQDYCIIRCCAWHSHFLSDVPLSHHRRSVDSRRDHADVSRCRPRRYWIL